MRESGLRKKKKQLNKFSKKEFSNETEALLEFMHNTFDARIWSLKDFSCIVVTFVSITRRYSGREREREIKYMYKNIIHSKYIIA